MKRFAFTLSVVLLAAAPALRAQAPLDEFEKVLPAKPALVVYWAGTDRMAALAGNTAVGQMLAGPLGQAFAEPLNNALMLLARVEGRNPIRTVPVSRQLLKSPFCIVVEKVNFPERPAEPGVPPDLRDVVRTAIVVMAPAGSPMRQTLDAFVAQATQTLPPQAVETAGNISRIALPNGMEVVWGANDTLFALGGGKGFVESVLAGNAAATLARDADYMAGRRQAAPAEPLALVHVDGAAVAELVDSLARMSEEQMPFSMTQMIDFKRYAAAVSVEGKGFRIVQLKRLTEAAAKAAPAAMDQTVLKHLPADAPMMSAGQFAPAAMYDRMAELILKAPGAADREDMQQVADQFQKTLGFKLRDDLLAHVGPRYALHVRRVSNMVLLPDIVVALEITDRDKVLASLDKLTAAAMKEFGQPGALREFDRRAQLAVLSSDYKGVPIRVVQIKGTEFPIAPALAVTDDALILAMSVPSLKGHLLHLQGGGKTAADIDAVAKALAQRGAGRAVGFSYGDTRATFEYLYGLVPLAYTGAASAIPVPLGLDIEKLPPAGTLSKEMFPSVGITRREGRTEISTSHSPLPLPEGQAVAVAAVPVMAAMLVPALSRAREAAKRAHSMNNLKQLGLAAIMYANERDGKLPDKVEELATFLGTRPGGPLRVFRSPADPRPDGTYEKGRLAEQSSYLLNKNLAGKNLNGIQRVASTPLMVERAGHIRDGNLVLFCDGHVEFIPNGPRLNEIMKQFE